DATHIESVPEYLVLDCSLGYKKVFSQFIKMASLSLEIKNLTDKKYTGIIDVSDDSQNGQAAYYTGFPRTVVTSLKIEL
ncbi:MAG: TonB-dependent receptor, partial [Flavobacteriaceae bacterium]|nr:TonB-dependent receptor [Flavobacteriaceae bacterium]